MNWLDKIINIKWSGLTILLIPFFFACDPDDLGLELDPDDLKTTLKDTTFILPVSTVYMDSLRTNHLINLVVGHYEDSVFGETTAIGYAQYSRVGGQLPGDSLKYDSAVLVLRAADVRAKDLLTTTGGGLGQETWTVHEGLETLVNGPQIVYQSDKDTPYNPDPIASHTFNFNPSLDTSIVISLSEEFGRELFEVLRRASLDSVSMDSLTNRLHIFQPLVFVPDENNNGLFSIDLSDDLVELNIYMSKDSTSYDYTFDLTRGHYSRIITDFAGTPLQSLSEDYQSIEIPGRTYHNSLSGIHPKIHLEPYLEFVKTTESFIVNGATLSLGIANDFEDAVFLENDSRLQFYFVKDDHRINVSGTLFPETRQFNALLTDVSYISTSSPTLLSVSLDTATSAYPADVTLFSQILADNFSNNSEFLTEELIILNPFVTTLSQTAFASSQVQLKVYYTIVRP